jgi:hypothetical protein
MTRACPLYAFCACPGSLQGQKDDPRRYINPVYHSDPCPLAFPARIPLAYFPSFPSYHLSFVLASCLFRPCFLYRILKNFKAQPFGTAYGCKPLSSCTYSVFVGLYVKARSVSFQYPAYLIRGAFFF